MRLVVLGCAWSAPVDGAGGSGYLVEVGRTRLLLDCGPGVLPELTWHASPRELSGVVVSHVHFDHCYDLLPLAWTVLCRTPAGGAPPRTPLWLPPGGTATLERLGAAFAEHASDRYVDFHRTAFDTAEYGGEIRLSFPDVTVELVGPTLHPAPCYAMRVECAEGVLAYSADSAPCAAVQRAAAGADLFVCEATWLAETPPRPDVHMTVLEAATLAADAGARELLLTHLTNLDGAHRQAVAAEARRWFGGRVHIAEPGLGLAVDGRNRR